MANFTLTDLEKIVADRATAPAGTSYTATLINEGIEKCAQKLGEEAVETVIAAVSENHVELKQETADLLYHLMVVLQKADVPLADIMSELESRTAQSGLDEKKNRG